MTIATDIQSLYIAYFNRPADYLGLKYWTAQAEANGGSVAAVANAFSASPEYTAQFAGQSSAQIINTIYLNLFGRPAEPDAIDYWGTRLDNKTFNIGTIATSILRGAQNDDKLTISNKVAAAEAFYAAMDTSEEIIGYDGAAANGVVKSWLSTVNATEESLAAATDAAALNTVLANAASAHNNTNGSTFTLGAGADTLTGTAGNDVFNALTVKADGTDATTFSDFDVINGGAGNDTLNIYTTAAKNTTFPTSATVTGIETVNILNAGAAAALADASKFTGVTALWQVNAAAAKVTNLEASTTAGLRSISVAGTTTFETTNAAATANIALDKVIEGHTLTVTPTAGGNGTLAAVNVSGNVVDADKDGTASINLGVTVGKDVQSLAVNSAVTTTLSVTTGAGTKVLSTVNAAASTGAITFAAGNAIANVTTGSGDDTLSLTTVTVKDNAGTAVDETVNAVVNAGAGDDTITINTTGDGKVTVVAGDGDDTVAITGRDTAALDVNLGAGNDVFTSAVAIAATDKIDAGAGTDTLLLNLVGSANVGAFSNFDAFDAKSLAKTLDIEILSTKNTVSEIVTTGDVGASAELVNVGKDVGYRIKADTNVANALKITQKAAGELVITHDIDETGAAATTTATGADAAVNATNATSLKAVFDSTFVGAVKAGGDNFASLSITAAEAKSLAIVSGGTVDVNDVNIVSAAKLETITITGASKTNIDVTSAAKLLTIDGSAATGGLTTTTASVIDGGSIKLGTGADIITLAVSAGTAVESLVGFEKAAAAAAGADAAAAATAIEAADLLTFTGAVANAATVVGGELNAKGVLTFTGAGPSTIAAAEAIANLAAETNGEALVFEYTGNTYVFVQGATDSLVQLTGVTGVTNLVEGTGGLLDHFAVV
ncbi:DUF4214 domain-containing protein [Massilia sp. YMA4]|uniref:beta strand repeat-containing protein n=1 Tax=Massilia sp. YMA4 TaxID=1593482 RepID=UPI000DD14940|nr:DUF4214 domain-containing protein [Massilia sp. YMA4]AXA94093.1 hypothetical protein DPH57_24935 [Massilia sp. YMA4]